MTNAEAKAIMEAYAVPVFPLLPAIERAIEALGKQIPKKPIWDKWNGEYHCGLCGVIMEAEYYYKRNFCGNCGQAIDWSEED